MIGLLIAIERPELAPIMIKGLVNSTAIVDNGLCFCIEINEAKNIYSKSIYSKIRYNYKSNTVYLQQITVYRE
jgi:hypothetical protein